jgi:predicted ATPase
MALIDSLRIKNFKGLEEVEIPLESNVVFVGPNNSGKTTALQALALWHLGAKKWLEKRGAGRVPKKRPGVTINRRDLITIPTPSAILLWRDLHVRRSSQVEAVRGTKNISIEIAATGTSGGTSWSCDLEFDYANEESLYCRSILMDDGSRKEVPGLISELKVAYLPPMSGLASHEKRLDRGAIDVLIGEGRTAEVLRNTCHEVFASNKDDWDWIKEMIEQYFGSKLNEPKYLQERGEIEMSFVNRSGAKLDLSSAGRGQQQTLLILAYMTANPGSVLLLDEPDAHLEILRQRQIYELISSTAAKTGGQVISASHSEVILKKAVEENSVIAFVGKPHLLTGKSSHVDKALRLLGYEQYLLAEETGWVLYLEGETDLRALKAFSSILGHPAKDVLERCFPSYVYNQPSKAKEHFFGLKGAYPELKAAASLCVV